MVVSEFFLTDQNEYAENRIADEGALFCDYPVEPFRLHLQAPYVGLQRPCRDRDAVMTP